MNANIKDKTIILTPERRISGINKKNNDGSLWRTEIPPLSIITGKAKIKCKKIKKPDMYIKYCMLAIPFFEAFLIMEYLFKAKITRIIIVILFIKTAIEDNPVGMPIGCK